MRCGYDYDGHAALWRQAVANAMRGARGQQFLRELVAALDAMPEKKLITEDFEREDGVCALGSVAKLRGLDLRALDSEDHDTLAERFGIARALVQEVEFVNDEDIWVREQETPEERWRRVRRWAECAIIEWNEA